MRLFFAIPLHDELKQLLVDQQAAISPFFQNSKWVARDNLHLTLLFLGETNEKLLPAIKSTTNDLLHSYVVSQITITMLNAFPSIAVAKTIIYDCNKPSWLMKLGSELRQCMQAFSFDCKQRFHPHITIARLREPIINLSTKFWEKFAINETINFTKFELIESILMPSGPEYRTVASFNIPEEG